MIPEGGVESMVSWKRKNVTIRKILAQNPPTDRLHQEPATSVTRKNHQMSTKVPQK